MIIGKIMMNEKVLNALKKLNIDYQEFEEAGVTKTVDDAAKTLNIERGQVAKSILVKPLPLPHTVST